MLVVRSMPKRLILGPHRLAPTIVHRTGCPAASGVSMAVRIHVLGLRRSVAVLPPGRRRRGPLRLAIAAIVALSMVVGVAGPAQAAPKPTVKQLKNELKTLQRSSDKLIADYYTGRIDLQKVEKTEKAAREQLDQAEGVYQRESAQIRMMATQAYSVGGLDSISPLVEMGDLNAMALAQAVADEPQASPPGDADVQQRPLDAY